MNLLASILRTRLSAAALVLALSSIAPTAHAIDFGVKVVNNAGVPVAGVAVCVGLHGNYKQFGAVFTDSTGTAIVEVPNIPIIVTVSKDRSAGIRLSEPARGYNLIKQVTLVEGVPGPRCRAGSSLAQSKPGVTKVRIGRVAVDKGVLTTTLKPVVGGNPSHYRISDKKNLKDAKWKRFSSEIAVNEFSNNSTVYLQMRRYEGNAQAWLEARSTVKKIRLN